MIDLFKLTVDVFGIKSIEICHQCVSFYCYLLFIAAFLSINLLYTFGLMSIINYIDCKLEGNTKDFAFAPSIFGKSFIAGNILVFEDLNIKQMGIMKTDVLWSDWLTI